MNIKYSNTTKSLVEFDKVFPVGCIFMSIVSTNPSTLLGGGTWTRIAQGRTLVGLNEDDNDFKSAEETGGEKFHKLTVDEMPSHNHQYYSPVIQKVAASNNSLVYGNYNKQYLIGTDFVGGNGPHNNLQPYYVTYIWKRTK